MLDHVSRKGQMLIHRVWLRSVKQWKMLKNGYNKFEKVSVRGPLILKAKGSVTQWQPLQEQIYRNGRVFNCFV